MTDQLARNKGTPHAHRRCRSWIFSAVACTLPVVFAVSTGRAAPQDKQGPAPTPNQVRVLLLTDARKLLTVHYLTKGRAIRNLLMTSPLTGGVGSIIVDAAETKHETSSESRILQKTVGEFDRRPVIDAGITSVFKDRTQYFDVVIPPDPSAYVTGNDINFSKAQADGYPYVLSVKEKYAGESTTAALGTLSAGSALEFKVFDTTTGKDLGKAGKSSGFSSHKQEFDPATSDRNAFMADYGIAVGLECTQLYGVLNKRGILHAMAEARGLGNEVPDLGAILARYEKRFDYDLKKPKHWGHLKGTTKYSATVAKMFKDFNKIRVVVTVDLMLPELGQKPGDLNEYIRLFFEHIQEDGYQTDTATPFKGLTLDPAYTVYSIDRPQGTGKEILAFRRLDDPFVVVYDVVIEQDYDEMMAKYSSDLQEIINESRIKIRE